ncbi:2,3,4,5-tetrahydropyridine-2,6-dicarboxylate N-acetyltransferase [subsurface metagenome]
MHEPTFLSDPDLRESTVVRRLFEAIGTRADARIVAGLARRLEGGQFRSRTLRRLLWSRYEVKAHAFSYGAFHQPGACEPGVTLGRFASVAREVRWGLSHPMDHVSLSHVFADPQNGFIERWPFERPTLEIGPDAWIGALVVITSNCRRIGLGAVVGAGSVVTRDVPDFAIAVGSPAQVIRYRFPKAVQETVRHSRWWERPLDELRRARGAFTGPVGAPETLRILSRLEG